MTSSLIKYEIRKIWDSRYKFRGGLEALGEIFMYVLVRIIVKDVSVNITLNLGGCTPPELDKDQAQQVIASGYEAVGLPHKPMDYSVGGLYSNIFIWEAKVTDVQEVLDLAIGIITSALKELEKYGVPECL